MIESANYIAIALGVLSVVFLIGCFTAIKQRAYTQIVTNLAFSMLFLFVGSFFALGALSLRGYHALTYEQPVATITITPVPNIKNQFKADFVFATGEKKSFVLSGDELSVDAHILKFKPIANIIGLHTAFELARVSGRYRDIKEAQKNPPSTYSLKEEGKWVDLFELRKKFAKFHSLVDVDYGSSSFIPVEGPQQFVLLVSTTGLLFRKMVENH